MVKLYNFSGLPDEPMLSLLTAAKLCVGARGDVIVKVTRGGRRVTSYARQAAFVYSWFLSRRRWRRDGKWKHGKVTTDGGYVLLQPRLARRYWNERVPSEISPTGFALRSRSAVDGLASAEHFFETVVHEFAHIVQFQSGFSNFAHAGCGRRRPKWAKRPEEIDAMNRTDDALARLAKRRERRQQIEEWIIELGCQIEAKHQAAA